MADITKEAVQDKLTKGEKLSAEETKFVMSLPPEGTEEVSDKDLGFDDDDTPEGDEDKEAEDNAAKEKADADEAEKKKSEDAAKEAEKAEAEKASKPKSDEESFHAKVERTLDMPDKDIALDGYTDREKGLFWTLRKERKARQQAEADRDAERFDRIKKDKLEAEKAKAKAEEKPAEDDEEFLTKGELKKREAEEKKNRELEEDARARKVIIHTSEIAAHGIIESRRAKGEDLPDYDKVMELGPVIIEGNEEYANKIYAVYRRGGNSALVTYDLIRNDPRFKSLFNPDLKPADKTPDKKQDETPKLNEADKGKENLKKIDENSKKPKTGVQSGGGDDGEYGEYTVEDLVNMSTSEFRKVPKNVREKFLKDMG